MVNHLERLPGQVVINNHLPFAFRLSPLTFNLSPSMPHHLLIVYHTQTGHTRTMARAVQRGARRVTEVETRLRMALRAGLDDLLWANGLLLGTPENFGYMSGALKNFLDRTYYPAQGHISGLPYAVFISAH